MINILKRMHSAYLLKVWVKFSILIVFLNEKIFCLFSKIITYISSGLLVSNISDISVIRSDLLSLENLKARNSKRRKNSDNTSGAKAQNGNGESRSQLGMPKREQATKITIPHEGKSMPKRHATQVDKVEG